jgi:hypothetical protein
MKTLVTLVALLLSLSIHAQNQPAQKSTGQKSNTEKGAVSQPAPSGQSAAPADKQARPATPAKQTTQTMSGADKNKPAHAADPKLKKDGTPDRRYKENQKLKKDGTPDMRYKQNKEKTNQPK